MAVKCKKKETYQDLLHFSEITNRFHESSLTSVTASLRMKESPRAHAFILPLQYTTPSVTLRSK